MVHEPWHFETDQGVDRVVHDGERVYVASSSNQEYPKIRAIEKKTGTVTWTDQISTASTVHQLMVANETVYCQTKHTHYRSGTTIRVLAFDSTTGMEQWSFERMNRDVDGPVMTELVVHAGHPYIGAIHEESDHTYGVYIPTKSCHGELEGPPTTPPRPGETEQSGEWVAVGEGDVEHPVSYFSGRDPDIIDPALTDYGSTMAPAEGSARTLRWSDGRLYAGTDSRIYAFQPGFVDGPILDVPTSGTVQSFRIAGETLFALTSDGLVAVDVGGIDHRRDRERHLWSAGDGPVTDAFVGEGTVYLTVNSRLYAVDASDGSGKWVFEADSQLRCVEDVSDGTLYATAGEAIYALDADTGEQRTKTTVEGRICDSSAPVLDDGILYLGASDGLHAIEPVERDGSVEFTTASSSEQAKTGAETKASADDTPGHTCPECGAGLAGDENFCPNCGHELAPTCPYCETELSGDENFCPDCGHDLSE